MGFQYFLSWDFSSRGFIHPTLTNTDTRMIDLDSMEFPLDIKICAEPGFNEDAIRDAGYKKTSYYFKGISRFNNSIVGWAGHTENFGVQGSVEEVYNKVRNHKMEDVVQDIVVDFRTEERLYLPLTQLSLNRVNYPQNCYTLDLSIVSEKRKEGIKTLGLVFKSSNIGKVQISLKGNGQQTNREVYDNSFYARGDTISVTPGRKNKYAVKISKNVYLEEDLSKRCHEYPTVEYTSYRECDDQYVRSICDGVRLAPIWLLDNISQATTQTLIEDSGIFICKLQ